MLFTRGNGENNKIGGISIGLRDVNLCDQKQMGSMGGAAVTPLAATDQWHNWAVRKTHRNIGNK